MKLFSGIPIAISRTHFLHSEPKLWDRVEGMAPDEAQHDSTFVMEPVSRLVDNFTNAKLQ